MFAKCNCSGIRKCVCILICVGCSIGICIGVYYTIALFKGGYIHSTDILGATSSILGGIIGVIGTFLLFIYQFEYTKKEDSKANSDIIKELLLYTIDETEGIINNMIDIYVECYVPGKKIGSETSHYKVLKKKVKAENQKNSINTAYGSTMYFSNPHKYGTFPYLVQCLGFGDEGFKAYDKMLVDSPDDKSNIDLINIASKIRELTVKEFRKLEENNDLIYYDNWKECLYKIIDTKLEDKRSILKWMNSINKTIGKLVEEEKLLAEDIGKLKKEFEEKYGYTQYVNATKDDIDYEGQFSLRRDIYLTELKYNSLRKNIINIICNFIKYRDEVIEVLKVFFGEKDKKDSTEILNEKFDSIIIQPKSDKTINVDNN